MKIAELEQGTYLDTEEKEYRSWPAINYSSLADFNESQDHALMERKAKSYFEEGTAFELLVEDVVKGSTKFSGRFFIADAPGAMPDALAEWIESGENLNSKYRLNQDGGRNNKSKRLHAWLDECRANPGKMPMGTDQIAMLNLMADNFLKMQPFQGSGNTLSEILPLAFFQVPIVWYIDKARKKALIDCMIETNKTIYAFDIKTAAEIGRFVWMLKKKYWIQEAHYTEGLQAIFPDKKIVWRFLASSKAEPNISQPFCVDPVCLSEYGRDAYFYLCERYQAWVDEGKPPKGWKELESVNIFFK